MAISNDELSRKLCALLANAELLAAGDLDGHPYNGNAEVSHNVSCEAKRDERPYQ